MIKPRAMNTLRPMGSPGRRNQRLAGFALAGLAFAAPGCFPSLEPAFDSPAPSKRLDAIVDAAAQDDRSTIPPLIDMLDSDDPAERMFAIRALERISGGRTFGYRYADPEWLRRDSVNRWVEWAESELAETRAPESPERDPGRSPTGMEHADETAQAAANLGQPAPERAIAGGDSEEYPDE